MNIELVPDHEISIYNNSRQILLLEYYAKPESTQTYNPAKRTTFLTKVGRHPQCVSDRVSCINLVGGEEGKVGEGKGKGRGKGRKDKGMEEEGEGEGKIERAGREEDANLTLKYYTSPLF